MSQIDENFLFEPPYSSTIKGVISSVMIRTSGIKNKYGSPEVNPPEMNKELDALFHTATETIRELLLSEAVEGQYWREFVTNEGFDAQEQVRGKAIPIEAIEKLFDKEDTDATK